MSPENALLKTMFPSTKNPLICSAPMLGISGPELITTVYKAGGLGFLGAGYDLAPLAQNLAIAQALIKDTTPLPIGVGVIVFRADLALWLSSLKPHTPAAVWLFAPSTQEQLNKWILATKAEYPETKIFVQIGSVAELTTLLVGEASEGVDVVVAQGVADSGGHGLQRGASIVGLVPEFLAVIKELRGSGKVREDRVLPVVAAGGVMDGRGAAAALTLGANGVVLGTRFILTPECRAPDGLKNHLLDLMDGGQNTVRTRIFDTLRGTSFWPPQYNGRGAANSTYSDSENGMLENENKALYEEAVADQDWNRLTMFCGTGVGLAKELQPAGEVVIAVREGAIKVLQEVAGEFVDI